MIKFIFFFFDFFFQLKFIAFFFYWKNIQWEVLTPGVWVNAYVLITNSSNVNILVLVIKFFKFQKDLTAHWNFYHTL